MPGSTCGWNAGTEQRVRGEGTGRIVREAKVASEPEALVRFFGQLGLVMTRIGLEGRTAVAMAACWPDAGRAGSRAARDPPGEGGTVGDGGEDRSQGCAGHHPRP
jgi:hypothetical protein